MSKKKIKNLKIVKPKESTLPFKEIVSDITSLDLLICLIVVCGLFIPTLVRPFLIYDERIFLEGSLFPALNSFFEIFEFIDKFGLNFNLISSNTLYTSNCVIRTCPFAQIFGTIISFLFKQEPFLYHSFSLFLHLINTCLVYFLLKVCLTTKDEKYYSPSGGIRLLLIILTSVWAIHPVMMEPVLLSTNCGALFTYMFFFSFLLEFLINKNSKSLLREVLIPILFLIPMLINEYLITLPFVLFIISFYKTYQINPFKKAFKKSIDETFPYFLGFIFYFIYFMFFSHYRTNQSLPENQLFVLIERGFWLAPQIFFHFLKLILYPKVLSIDQSLFVHLGKNLFDPYSIFCIIVLASWLFMPLLSFLSKKRAANAFLLSWTFFFALLPFLHILMPSYTLANERYLYCPLALLILGFTKILADSLYSPNNEEPNNTKTFSGPIKVALPIILSFILVLCSLRSQARTQDWKDNYTFISSTYENAKDPLFKAIKLGMLGKAISILEPNQQGKSRDYFFKTLELLQEAREEITHEKLKFQKTLPLVLKSYGLDYDSLLAKAAFLEASSRCLELQEDYRIGLKLLEPYIKKKYQLDSRILELYIHFLVLDKNYDKAKKVLLKANSLYPNTQFILLALANFSLDYEKDRVSAEKYIQTALKFYPYDPDLLLKAFTFYKEENNPILAAKYAHLFGLRTHSKAAYQHALSMYLNIGQLKEAGNITNKLLKIDPKDPETLYFVSEYYYKVKDFQKALFYLIDAYSLSKNTEIDTSLAFDISHALAKLYLFLGDKEKANLLTQEILHLAGKNPKALYKLAKLYNSLGLAKEEKEIYKQLGKIQ